VRLAGSRLQEAQAKSALTSNAKRRTALEKLGDSQARLTTTESVPQLLREHHIAVVLAHPQ